MNIFENLGLQDSICKALEELGFTEPTDIQTQAIPVFIKQDRDVIALAQTGTGKTAAFGLPILQNIKTDSYHTQALIISPTRELCVQISNDLKKYSKYLRGVRIVSVYGGSSISLQIRDLKAGAHIIVATPGRLMDLMDRKAVKLGEVNTVVLDEADEMLNMGFREDMENILSHTPAEKITGLFSATMSPDIRSIANRFLENPVEITVGKKNAAQQNISHQYAVVQARDKFNALKRIIDFHDDFYGIVFCTTKVETQDLSDHLVREGYSADCLHGDLAQAQRDKVMHRFRHKAIKALLATDVAARGIDVKNLTHIIHYHLPDDLENYTHRSGRTARAGQKGISIALLHIREAYKLHQIERMAGVRFEKYIIPKGDDVLQARVNKFIESFTAKDAENKFSGKFKNEWIWPLMQLEKEDLVQRILELEFNKFGTRYIDAPDINIDEKVKERSSTYERSGTGSKSRGTRNSTKDSSSSDASVRCFINVGKKDGMKYDQIRELIFQNSKVSGRNIKDIEMKGVYSFFMTDEDSAARMRSMTNAQYAGRPLRIQLASEQKDYEAAPTRKKRK
ncbi:MAG: DEAD/DEAH box helicase [Bacteroidota bacterium]|nr:DEAD/DEAH box helicase [Bacteroidota bacterium]